MTEQTPDPCPTCGRSDTPGIVAPVHVVLKVDGKKIAEAVNDWNRKHPRGFG